ncbi:hypothetical protein HX875_08950 [Pseudomonas yamanorum]|uniref:hypothetical protein n=1 Tax=Pseudomonas yamanorum TaxID=515393 RepID=UPI0015A49DE9|nr:hypothetical protein [Pseudomonas yamanorum]NWE39590.1 hypothetical protein [Pseudomonas yamanorum]
MSYPKIARLIETLLSQTEAGTLQWAQTEKSEVFQASFPRYSIRIYPENSSNFQPDYFLQILNEVGEIVEVVSDPDLRDVMDMAFTKMQNLYEGARRSAMGVESALDEILDFLDPLA